MFNKPLLVNTVLFCISYINDLIGKPKGWIATRQNLELTIPYVMNKNDEFVFKKNKKTLFKQELSFKHLCSTFQLIWEILVNCNLPITTCPADSAPVCSCWLCVIWPSSTAPPLFMYCCSIFFFSVSAQSSYIGRKHNYFKINIDTKSLL